jgi:hypothetical protein
MIPSLTGGRATSAGVGVAGTVPRNHEAPANRATTEPDAAGASVGTGPDADGTLADGWSEVRPDVDGTFVDGTFVDGSGNGATGAVPADAGVDVGRAAVSASELGWEQAATREASTIRVPISVRRGAP